MTRILLVDNNTIVRKGIQGILEEYFQISEIRFRQSDEDIFELLEKDIFDLLVIDPVYVPNIDDFQQIKELYQNISILACSEQEEKRYVVKLLQAGVHGFLPKSTSKAEFFFALDSVMNKRLYISPKLFQEALDDLIVDLETPKLKKPLSNKELQVAHQLITGTSIKEIARILNLSSPSVSNYKNKIFHKTNLSTIVELEKYLNNLSINSWQNEIKTSK
jgi:DNA-binding NarL/FixJ family response regulator